MTLAGEIGDKMSMILEVAAASGFLRVSSMGRFSLAEAKRTFIEMLEAVARNKVGKVLFDGRGLVGNPKAMERFYYGEFAAKSVAEFADRGVSRTHSLRTFLKSQYVTLRGLAKPSQ
jgi:hypothetical protein